MPNMWCSPINQDHYLKKNVKRGAICQLVGLFPHILGYKELFPVLVQHQSDQYIKPALLVQGHDVRPIAEISISLIQSPVAKVKTSPMAT